VTRIANALMKKKLVADYNRKLNNLWELVEAAERTEETTAQLETVSAE
jgi:hypothetical protein